MTNKDADQILEEKIKRFENRIEAGVLDWVRNDQAFNGLRNTPARVLLWVIAVGVIYGFPIAALFTDQVSIWAYIAALLACLVAQKISVRFVFDDDDVIDEYQHARRNKAYRRAYKRIAGDFVFAAILCIVGINYQEHLMGSGWVWEIDTYKATFGLVFVIGLFSLQKYLSWGFKGEPWTDSAQKKGATK